MSQRQRDGLQATVRTSGGDSKQYIPRNMRTSHRALLLQLHNSGAHAKAGRNNSRLGTTGRIPHTWQCMLEVLGGSPQCL